MLPLFLQKFYKFFKSKKKSKSHIYSCIVIYFPTKKLLVEICELLQNLWDKAINNDKLDRLKLFIVDCYYSSSNNYLTEDCIYNHL